MKNRILYTISATFLVAVLAFSCDKTEVADIPYAPKTAEGKAMLENSDVVARIFSDTTYMLTQGVDVSEIHFMLTTGYTSRVFLSRIDLNRPDINIKVSMPYDLNVLYQKQTLTQMAGAADKPAQRVMAMINGDFYNTSTIALRGPLHRNGVVLKSDFMFDEALPQQALSFVAIRNDGTPYIGYADEYAEMAADLKETTGGGVVVLRNGEIPGIEFPQIDPRTVIGYSKDNIVYFMVGDGRDLLYSYGFSYYQLGSIMKSLGMDSAINLDGGGSAQFLIRHPVVDVWNIRNRPTDGAERPVANGWMVVKTS